MRNGIDNSKRISSETIQRLTTVTDDMLKTIIMMSSSLLAIGVIFDDFISIPLLRIIIILMFFLGLITSFVGVLPFSLHYDLEDAEEYKSRRLNSFLRKRRHLWLSAACIAFGFILVIIDLIYDVVTNWSPSSM